jgi:hypothetical protein
MLTTPVRLVRTDERGDHYLECGRCGSQWIRPKKRKHHDFGWSCPGCYAPGPSTEQQHVEQKVQQRQLQQRHQQKTQQQSAAQS